MVSLFDNGSKLLLALGIVGGLLCMIVFAVAMIARREEPSKAAALIGAVSGGLFLFGIGVYALGVLLFGFKNTHAANEFCRNDTVGKVTYETCVTPVSPALMPVTPTAER